MKNKNELKKWIILILVTVTSFWIVNNLGLIFAFLGKILKVLTPFIAGICLAYVLNILMMKIENFLINKLKLKNGIRGLAIFLSLIILMSVLAVVLLMLIPELVENIESLIENIPLLISSAEEWVVGLLDKYPDMQYEIQQMFKENTGNNDMIVNLLNYVLNGSVNIISSLVSGVITIFTSFIFAIYMLSQKESLIDSLKRMIDAYFNEKIANEIMNLGKLANNTFSRFISGQCLDAVILGCIFFVLLTIFRFPYALLISVLTTITALIPIFGAMISMVIGAILIAITDPFQAFIFILLFLLVQQIEENFIYPKVVGKSVGLSPVWTLLAITVGGGLFGILGMLVALPVTSIIYTLVVNEANKRIVNKNKIKKENFV